MLTQHETNLVSSLVALVDAHSNNGEYTTSNGFEEQYYMNDMLQDGKRKGFNLLGSGYFSGVFSHEGLSGKVIKVGLRKEDSGAAYAAWCRANQRLEGIPVIHHIARHASCYTVVLDELKPFDKCVNTDEVGAIKWLDQNEDQQSLVNAYEAAKCGIYDRDLHGLQGHEDIYETCVEIRKFFTGIASFDLHSMNIMVHPVTGKLVITDPVSFVKDEALDGFDVELNISEKKKQMDKIAASRRLRESTMRLAFYALHGSVIGGLARVSIRERSDIIRRLVDKHKANLAIDQLRGVMIDLDNRLQNQFLRG